jgi:hypothetical protein
MAATRAAELTVAYKTLTDPRCARNTTRASPQAAAAARPQPPRPEPRDEAPRRAAGRGRARDTAAPPAEGPLSHPSAPIAT